MGTLNDRGLLAYLLLSTLSKIFNPGHNSLVKDLDSNKINDFLINKTIPVTLYNNLLTFRDTDKKFELNGDPLKKITDKYYNLDYAKLPDEKIMFEFAKEMYFDEWALGDKSSRDQPLVGLPQSSALMASGISTIRTILRHIVID